MVFVALTMQAHNDNEELSFITLGAATLNVVRWLEKDRCDRPAGKQDEKPSKEIDRKREQERFIETRLREIERFERRLRGGQDRPCRKKN